MGLLLVTACLASGGCAASSPSLREHWSETYDARQFGADEANITRYFNVHRGRWWNYYARGCWYLESGHPAAAEADFRRTAGLRAADKRNARSYGMHFWDYFPHRELGIALYRLGRPGEAVGELRTSLATEESSRARSYLNKALAAQLTASGEDTQAPVIRAGGPPGKLITNRLTPRIRCTVTDDQYVRSISVAGRSLFIEQAAPSIEVDEEVPLEAGRNVVVIEATDLVDHTRTERIEVLVDVTPPVICIQDMAKGGAAGDRVLVDLAAVDNLGLTELWDAGRPAGQCLVREHEDVH